MGLLDKIFNGGEESIIGDTQEIIKIAKEANGELFKLVNGNIRSVIAVKTLEKESDRKVFLLTQKITSGAVSPNVIDDMLKLLDMEDSIVDHIYNLTSEIVRYKPRSAKIERMLQQRMVSVTRLIGNALETMKKMTGSSNIESIRIYRKEIEVYEQKGDDIKDSLLDYTYSNSMDFKTFHYINELAHRSDDILDSCEDASDMFLSIMVSIIS